MPEWKLKDHHSLCTVACHGLLHKTHSMSSDHITMLFPLNNSHRKLVCLWTFSLCREIFSNCRWAAGPPHHIAVTWFLVSLSSVAIVCWDDTPCIIQGQGGRICLDEYFCLLFFFDLHQLNSVVIIEVSHLCKKLHYIIVLHDCNDGLGSHLRLDTD